MNDRVKVALIYGSTRKGRFCDKVAAWAANEIARRGEFSVDIIDPQAQPELPSLQERIAEADAFVVVTPEYNHGYPAPLKALIDSVGAEWRGKPSLLSLMAESPEGCAQSSNFGWFSRSCTQ